MTLDQLNKNLLREWERSLAVKPSVLTTDMCIMPIHSLVKDEDQMRALKKAHKALFVGKISYRRYCSCTICTVSKLFITTIIDDLICLPRPDDLHAPLIELEEKKPRLFGKLLTLPYQSPKTREEAAKENKPKRRNFCGIQ